MSKPGAAFAKTTSWDGIGQNPKRNQTQEKTSYLNEN